MQGTDPSGRSSPIAPAVLAVLAALAPAVGHLTRRFEPNNVADADHLLLVELFADLGAGGTLSQWYLPYSGYLVPDWLFYGAATVVTPNVIGRLAVVAFLQTTVFVVAVWLLGDHLDGARGRNGALVAAAVTVLAAIADLRPAVFLATMFIHTGTYAASLLALWLLLRHLGSADRRAMAVSALLTLAICASDRLFVVWFLVPATVALVGLELLGRCRPSRRTLEWLGAHVAASVLSIPLAGLVRGRPTVYDVGLGFEGVADGISSLRLALVEAAVDGWWLIGAAALAWGVLVIRWAIRWWPSARHPTAAPRETDGPTAGRDVESLVAVFAVGAAAATLLAQFLLTGIEPHVRYNGPLLITPLLLVGALHGRALNRIRAVPVSIGVLAVVLVTGLPRFDVDRPPPVVACIDGLVTPSGSTVGIASYWDARQVNVFGGELRAAGYSFALVPDRVNVSASGFVDRYDYVVSNDDIPVGQIDLAEVERRHGAPRATQRCGPFEVWDYGPGGLDLAPLRSPGDRRTYEGCELRSTIGAVDDETCDLVATAGADGFVAFGPYLGVRPGRYTIELELETSVAGTAVWDVAITTGTARTQVVAEGPVPAAGTPGTVSTDITFDAALSDYGLLEVRVVSNGGGAVRVSGLTVTRLD